MRWVRRGLPDEDSVRALGAATALPAPAARLLLGRGISTPEQIQSFLHPDYAHLHSPFLMMGMAAASERLMKAIAGREKILIYGDYDVDGTIAVVILKTAIELCGGACSFHVPHRIREGYGMKDDVIARGAAEGVRLIISVDTGIRAFAAAETAQRLGVDLIVTDHHLPQAQDVPKALAVLNPMQPGCTYPCKYLCGAGVAFKLAQAVMEKAGLTRQLPSFLKVVAIATIADAVPLVGENRVFAKLGLEALRTPVNAGLKALLEVAQLNGGKRLTASDVAFRLAPRLNAAGRMDMAGDVIDLFSTRNAAEARALAERMDRLNQERQQQEQRICDEIDAQLNADPRLANAWCLVVDGEGWHKGVIGIAASRLLDRTGRPALVISRDGELAQGSARSIDAFHMLDALESCRELFTRFGGHAHAAGFALPAARIPELRERLEARARALLSAADLEPTLAFDTELALDQITPELFHCLQGMDPFGMGNPEPVFVARNLRLLAPPRVVKEKHFKIRVHQPAGETTDSANPSLPAVTRAFDAVAWKMAERLKTDPIAANQLLDLAFCVFENSHPDFGGLELRVCDYVVRPA
jgi:single-stranded-DNA-specific exonuclease